MGSKYPGSVFPKLLLPLISGYNKKKHRHVAKKWADWTRPMCWRENNIQTKNKSTNNWDRSWERNVMAYCVWKAFLQCRDEGCGQQLTLALNSLANRSMGGQNSWIRLFLLIVDINGNHLLFASLEIGVYLNIYFFSNFKNIFLFFVFISVICRSPVRKHELHCLKYTPAEMWEMGLFILLF